MDPPQKKMSLTLSSVRSPNDMLLLSSKIRKKKFLLGLFLVGIFTLLSQARIGILACKGNPLKRGGVSFSNLRYPDHAHVFGKSCQCGLNQNKPMQLPISPFAPLLLPPPLDLRATSIRIGCFAVTAKLGYLDFRYGKSRWGYLNFSS